MTASSCANRDDPIDARRCGLFRMTAVNHIVEHQSAIAVHRIDYIPDGTERGDDQRHLVRNDDPEVGTQPRI
jgi:hypothetical protein